jgi:hypothetical protein
MPWVEFESRTFWWFYYLYPCFMLENCICLSRGVQVAGEVGWATIMIVVGVGDLV